MSIIIKSFKRLENGYEEHGITGIIHAFLGLIKLFFYRYIFHIKYHYRHDYNKWLKEYYPIKTKLAEDFIKEENFDNFLISIVMPVYDPDPIHLNKAIESVRDQIYNNWELCIVDDCSTNPCIKNILDTWSNLDKRINVFYRETNGHISASSNDALERCRGEYITFLDHDDMIAPDALYHMSEAINKNRDIKIIYSDEDKIDTLDNHYDPYFKCNFNYCLMLSQNMFCHMTAYSRSLVEKVGLFRLGYEGVQDYDYALRAIELVTEEEIFHIPLILYHWRSTTKSTATTVKNKPYVIDRSKLVITDHFRRISVEAVVSEVPEAPLYNKVNYCYDGNVCGVGIIIPTRDHVKILRNCIDSIINKTTYKNYNIYIIDNGSSELSTLEYLDYLKTMHIKVLKDGGMFNFARLNNMAMLHVKEPYVCLLNNDIEIITPNWIQEMLSFATRENVGCVGARLWYPNNTLQHGGIITGLGGVAGHSHKYLPRGEPGYFHRACLHQEFSAVTAAALMIRKDKYLLAGGMDERFSVAFNDVDFCLRISELGFKNIWTPFAEMYHHESISRGYDLMGKNKIRFKQEIALMKEKWGNKLINDPYYSKNLTLDYEDFSLAWPPRL